MLFEKAKRVLVAAVLTVFVVPAAHALGPHNVVNTVHNLSSTGPQAMYNTDTTQVCVFCHTPHGGNASAPLWNRQMPTSSWTHYDSSTLTSVVGSNPTRPVSAESLMCLSCHDGSIATNRVLNPPDGLTGVNAPQPSTQFGDSEIVGIPGVFNRIGAGPADPFGVGDLSDDHPISFDYQDVLDSGEDNGFHTVANARTAGVRFFPLDAAGGSYRVECSSCHDPHVDYETNTQYKPFLVASNDGSALCKACHNK